MRQTFSSLSPFEPIIGFSRAVKIDHFIAVSGTAPLGDSGQTVGLHDVYLQTKQCIYLAEKALHHLGARLDQVIRTRILLTDINRWQEAAKAHGEFFSSIRPAATFMQVVRFINPEWLVELEIDAILPSIEP